MELDKFMRRLEAELGTNMGTTAVAKLLSDIGLSSLADNQPDEDEQTGGDKAAADDHQTETPVVVDLYRFCRGRTTGTDRTRSGTTVRYYHTVEELAKGIDLQESAVV
jgi:phage tail tape-measure protein